MEYRKEGSSRKGVVIGAGKCGRVRGLDPSISQVRRSDATAASPECGPAEQVPVILLPS